MAQSTCGYADGNIASPRVAAPGFDCRVDTANNIWGFCPKTVVAATDCGLAGYCVDSHDCKNGCGPLSGRIDITTFTCTSSQAYCSFLISINGDSPASSYSYIGCADHAITDTIYAVPTAADSTTLAGSSIPSSTTAPMASAAGGAASSGTIQTEAAASASSASSSSQGSSAPLGAIIGGTIGGIAIVCVTVLVAIMLWRRQNSHKTPSSVPAPSEVGGPEPKADQLLKQPPRATHQVPVEVSELGSNPAELSGTHMPTELYAGPPDR